MAIQGFGNAGQFAATLGQELLGAKIVAVSDSRGGIYDAGGLDPDKVIAHKQQTGSVVGYAGAAGVGNAELLELTDIEPETTIAAMSDMLDLLDPAALATAICESDGVISI